MAEFICKTNSNSDLRTLPRIYFTCHPDDLCFVDRLLADIFRTHDCAVYYTADMTAPVEAAEQEVDLGRHNLFVVPVTEKLLTLPSRAMDVDIPFAIKRRIPILPVIMEAGLEELYARPDKFGSMQFLVADSTDSTAISYNDKLKKYLDSVLIGKELADRVRGAFDAYIFLSYRKKDRRLANDLMRLIHNKPECRDIAIWFDEFLTPGESFLENIRKALKNSKLFTLLVTPNLLEEPDGKPNFVMGEEYPAALQEEKEILAVEMEATDRNALEHKFCNIPQCVNPYDRASFYDRLAQLTADLACKENNDPVHNYLIGLAYLEGIDVEVDCQRAAELITGAAEAALPEAMERLIHMYTDGIGVSVDRDRAARWSERLADFFYNSIFSADGVLEDTEQLRLLFSHYADSYWSCTIRLFLQKTDACAQADEIRRLYELIEDFGIHEYTVLFEACAEMTCHKEETQLRLVSRILRCSTDGTYPPYGHLFWYVPEYNLYEVAISAAWDMRGNARALALVRDVCFIFGQYDRIDQITDRVNGKLLFLAAKAGLQGVRRSLCQLFFTGQWDGAAYENLYPRCFNPMEAVALAQTGMGIQGRMTCLFRDELGLFGPTDKSKPPVGLVILPYDSGVEQYLAGSIPFVRGLILLDSENVFLDYLEFYRGGLKVFYIPENCPRSARGYARHMETELSVLFFPNESQGGEICSTAHQYIRSHVRLPAEYTGVEKRRFLNCKGLKAVTFPPAFAGPQFEEDDPLSGARLGESSFENCSGLQELMLPANLRHIESKTFQGCTALSCVHLPDTLQNVGFRAFAQCTALEKLEFGYCANIENEAFAGCKALTSVTFATGFERIGVEAFAGCRNLENINFLQGIRMIADYAFSGTALRRVEFTRQAGLSVAADAAQMLKDWARFHLGIGVFSRCSQLEEAILPDDLTAVTSECFMACSALHTLRLPSSLESIEEKAFGACSSLRRVELPHTLKYIGASAFVGCGLVRLHIPESVTEIGDHAFAHNASLEAVCIENPMIRIGFQAFAGCDGVTHAILPDSLRNVDLGLPPACRIIWIEAVKQPCKALHISAPDRIPDEAYRNCVSVSRVVIEKACAIGAHAFDGCTALEEVEVSSDLTELGSGAFAGCSSLRNIPFLPQIRILGSGAFENCTAVQKATLYSKLHTLEEQVFSGCTALQTIVFPPNLQCLSAFAFFRCKNLCISKIPKQVSEIQRGAFAECAAIEKMQLPGVESIQDQAFAYCTGLSELRVGPKLKQLGSGVFCGCKRLRTVALDRTRLQWIPENCFEKCSSLEQVTLPPALQAIGQEAFAYCVSLQKLIASDKVEDLGQGAFALCEGLQTVVLPSIDTVPDCAFLGCVKLEQVQLSPSVQKIGSAAFLGCTSLKAAPLGQTVTAIDERAFYNCTGLTCISIPLSVKEIGDDAFAGCTALTSVEISRNFRDDIERIFGQLDPRIIRYHDTSGHTHTTVNRLAGDVSINQKGRILPEEYRGNEGITGLSIEQVTEIGDYAFEECTGLKSVEINTEKLSLGKGVFRDCPQLQTVKLTDSAIKKIPEGTFKNCAALQTVALPSCLQTVDTHAFAKCAGLRTLDLPDSLEFIGFEAFRDNTSLTELRIPASVNMIGNNAFAGCTSLTHVEISHYFKDQLPRIFGQIDPGVIHCYDAVNEELELLNRILNPTAAPAQEASVEGGLLDQAVEVFLAAGVATASMLQRRMRLGYAKAARIVDVLEELGIVGPFLGTRPRELLIDQAQWEAMGKTLNSK